MEYKIFIKITSCSNNPSLFFPKKINKKLNVRDYAYKIIEIKCLWKLYGKPYACVCMYVCII